jgi:hypothetical protein
MRAQAQSLGPVILHDFAAHRHGRECNSGLMRFGAKLAITIIGCCKEGECLVAQAFDCLRRLTSCKTQAPKPVRARDAMKRGHRYVGAAPQVLDGSVGARLAGGDNPLDIFLGQAPHHAEAKPHRVIPAFRYLQRAVPC